MRDGFDYESIGRVLDRLFDGPRQQSKGWVSIWFAACLTCAAISAAFNAPQIAYGVPIVVLIAAVFADIQRDDSD